ncbi:MAG: flagellar M-ring protein FliF [Oligoflexia bacterium]|nr:flagellar M-ring protein FliF [Oligoflexia bacterium]
MNDFFTKIVAQFRTFFLDLPVTRQISVIAIFVAVIVLISTIMVWALQTRYKVLFSELNKEDATMVSRMLQEKNIPYTLSEDGKTISVPKDQVEIWRLELAKQGLNFSGKVGYEILDNQGFGTTSFVQKINKQRALEGELTKTISYIRGVKRARVHLSIPENSPFVSEKKNPSASIVLELDYGVTLTPEEVRGIGSLVSATVEGMRPQHVVIIDSRGQKLSDNIGDQMTADTANKLVLEARFSKELEEQIEDILTKVVGVGKVTAKVSVKMDFTEVVSTETKYDNEGAAVLSEVSNTSKLVGSRPSPQGIPGARSNIPGESPQPGIPETKNDVDKKITTKNFNVPSTVINTKKPTANIKAITAAVVLDGKQVVVLDKDGKPMIGKNGTIERKYVAWSEQDLNNFSDLVSSTIGIDSKRGDKLVIRNMEFVKEDLSESEEILKRMEQKEIIRNIVKYLAVGVVLSLFFLVVVRPFIQWITENTVESVEDFLPRTIEELEKVQADQKLPGLEDALPQIEEKINPEKIEGNMLKEKIISLVEENPAKAAQIIHTMIHTADSEKQIA